jgi:hypothetical protein
MADNLPYRSKMPDADTYKQEGDEDEEDEELDETVCEPHVVALARSDCRIGIQDRERCRFVCY